MSTSKTEDANIRQHMKPFCERLQYLAFREKIEQIDLVVALEKNKGTISKWWRGEIVPGPKNTRAISEYFKCDYQWLLYGQGKPFPKPDISTETSEIKSEFQEKKNIKDTKTELAEAKRLRFKNQCGSYLFDEFFDFIAEYYGEDKVGVDAFFLKLYESHENFRTWVDEKKARDDSQNKGLDNISADLNK